MNDEQRDNAEAEKLSLAKKVWLGFLIFCYLLFCSVLILMIAKFYDTQDITVLQSPAVQIAVVLMLLGCLFSVLFCGKWMATRPPKGNRYR